jgi:transcriptional regulator with XRE-family HTH domain
MSSAPSATLVSKPQYELDRTTVILASAPMRLGATVTQLRGRSGLTRQALASRSWLSKETVARLERGRSDNPSLHAIAGVATALGVSVLVLTDAFVLPLGAPLPRSKVLTCGTPSPVSRRSRGADLGLVLRAYRTDAGLSVAELETRAGTTRMQLARLEAGRPRPGLAILARIAAALDGSAEDLAAGAATLGVLAQVYAGEIKARDAIVQRRMRGTTSS